MKNENQITPSDIQQKVLEIFTEEANRAFLIDSLKDKSLTFGEVYNSALAVATLLRKKGINPGERIIYVLPNCYEFAVLYFASLLAGIVAVPVSPVMHSRDIGFIAQHCRAKMLFTADETMPQIASFVKQDMGMDIMYLEQGGEKRNEVPPNAEILDMNNLNISSDKLISPFEDVPSDQRLAIVYTSGTTSRPKGVVHKVSSMLNNALSFNHELEIGNNNRFYGILAMGYLGGYYNLLMLPFMAGASVVITRAFDARSPLTFWEPAEKYGVNTLWFVPTIMAIMLKVDRSEEGPQFCRKEVKRAIVGTAPLPRKLKRDFENHYGIKLYENYGLSETFFVTTEAPKYSSLESSVGKILPEVEVRIVAENGEPLPYNSEGEILVRTPFLMEGYYNPDIGKPDCVDKKDWFPTEDIGYLISNGELFITGRKKDLIIKGGVNISPMAIENVLHEYEAIEETAVIGIPHEIYGEDVAAAIKFKESYTYKEEIKEIEKLCQQNLAPNQRPSFFFEIEEFPRSTAGKVQKSKVKELILTKLGLKSEEEKAAIATTEEKPIKKKLMVVAKVRRNIRRPPRELIEKIKKFPASIISDCLNRLRVMDSCIKPLVRGRPFAGPAFTVEEVEGGNLMSHIALEIIQPDDILVIDAKGTTTRSCWGGLQTYAAKLRGVAGIIIFGTVRDYQEIVKCDIPVYAIGVSPGGPLKGWSGFINYPISCGGVPVLPGDVIVGDDDGIVVVPSEFLEEVLSYCEERIKREEGWFKDVEKGISTLDTVGLRENVERLGIEFL